MDKNQGITAGEFVMRTAIIIGLLLFVAACTPSREWCNDHYPPRVHDSVWHDTIVRDSLIPIYTPPDSAWLKAWLECDQNGQLIMKRLEEYQAGSNVKPSIQVNGNTVWLKCKVDSGKVYSIFKSREIRTGNLTVKELPPVKINVLTWWQQAQIYGFRVLGILALAGVIFLIVKMYLKTRVI